MNDQEKMIEMLTRAGIAFTVTALLDGLVTLTVEGGYAGFYTEFEFGVDGALLRVSAWE